MKTKGKNLLQRSSQGGANPLLVGVFVLLLLSLPAVVQAQGDAAAPPAPDRNFNKWSLSGDLLLPVSSYPDINNYPGIAVGVAYRLLHLSSSRNPKAYSGHQVNAIIQTGGFHRRYFRYVGFTQAGIGYTYRAPFGLEFGLSSYVGGAIVIRDDRLLPYQDFMPVICDTRPDEPESLKFPVLVTVQPEIGFAFPRLLPTPVSVHMGLNVGVFGSGMNELREMPYYNEILLPFFRTRIFLPE